MKKLNLLLVVLLFSLNSNAQHFDWAKKIDALGADITCESVVLDEQNNIYIAGVFSDTADFDPGIGVFQMTSGSSNYYDLFITKLDSNGDFIWAKQIALHLTFSMTISELPHLSISNNGKLNILGTFNGTVDFNPGSGTNSLTSFGLIDVFICQLDQNGDFNWAKKFGGTDNEKAFAMDIDSNGNIYSTGYYRNQVDFNPGVGVYNLDSSGVFISKLDSNGNFVYAKRFNGLSKGGGIHIDGQQNVVIVGSFFSNQDFDPSASVYYLNCATGNDNAFIVKLNSSGDFLWAKNFGPYTSTFSMNEMYVRKVVSDYTDNIIISGYGSGNIDFDPSTFTHIELFPTSAGNDFVTKLDANGNFLQVILLGNGFQDIIRSFTIDSMNNIFMIGSHVGIIDIDPSTNVFNLGSLENSSTDDIFIEKLDSNFNLVWAKNIGHWSTDIGFDIVVNNSGSTYAVGGYNDTVDFDPSPNINLMTSLGNPGFICKFSECPSSITSIISSDCDSISLLGQTFYGTGVYYLNLYSSSNCDSLIAANLTIFQSTVSTLNQNACNSFLWNGQTYTISGFLSDTLSTTMGCDSIINLNLTVHNIDTTITQNGAQLIANATTAVYQWVYCPSYTPVFSSTNQVFQAPLNGDYAVIIFKNGCEDTSACYTVNNVGIESLKLPHKIELYPNPSNGYVELSSSSNLQNASIFVYNNFGSLIHSEYNLYGNKVGMNMSFLSKGIYYVKLINQDSISHFNLLIE